MDIEGILNYELLDLKIKTKRKERSLVNNIKLIKF